MTWLLSSFGSHVFDEIGIMMGSVHIQGTQDLLEPIFVKSAWSSLGNGCILRFHCESSNLYILTMLTKKRYTSEAFELTEAASNAFYPVKYLLANSANMNTEDFFIMYTDSSMKAIGGVLIQV